MLTISAPHSAPAAPQKQRLAWPDVARGVSILGVVLLHVRLAVPEGEHTLAAQANELIDPLRLPLFFIISGFFSQKVLNFRFGELFRKRLWFLLIPYLVWSIVELRMSTWDFHYAFDTPLATWPESLRTVMLGHSMGWFLHSLVLYNIFLWAVRKLPPWAALAASFTPLLFLGYTQEYFVVGKAIMFLPVFMAGVYLRPAITTFAESIDSLRHPTRATWWALALTAATYAASVTLRDRFDERVEPIDVIWPLPGAGTLGFEEAKLLVRFAEQALQLPAGIAAAVLLAHVPFVSGCFRFIGSHTLPIYLGHHLGIIALFGFPKTYYGWDVTKAGEWPLESTDFWIWGCFAAAAVGSLALWLIEKIPVARWTMVPPRLPSLKELWRQRRAQREHATPR